MGLQNILKKTEEYLDIPSITRFEYPFINYLAEDFNILGCKVKKQDRALIVRKRESMNQKIVTAHIDRLGIIVNQDKKFEYSSFNTLRYYKEKIGHSEEIFKISGERFVGEVVYAYDSTGRKLEEGLVKGFSSDFNKKDLFFEIEGIKSLHAEMPLAYKSKLVRKDGSVLSQIDNVICVAVAYQLICDGFDGTLIFTTEEEVGRSWKHIINFLAENKINSQEILTLDTSPYTDSRAIQDGLVILRNKDASGEYNSNLIAKLKLVCENEGIKYEFKDKVIEAQIKAGKPKSLGQTELGRIVKNTNGKYNGATIELPTTGYHTNHETTSELALNNFYEALKKLL